MADLDQRTIRMADHVLLKRVHNLGRTRSKHAVVTDQKVVRHVLDRCLTTPKTSIRGT